MRINQRNYGLEVHIARFHNIFGPEGSWKDGREKAPAAMCRKVAETPDGGEIEMWGDGLQTRSFLYIDECIEGIIRLVKSDFSGPVNLGSDEMVTINQLVDLLGGDKVYIPKRPGEPNCTFADISKIKSDLKWTLKISINQGVEEILKNINYWKDAPIWTSDSIANATKSWFHYLEEK